MEEALRRGEPGRFPVRPGIPRAGEVPLALLGLAGSLPVLAAASAVSLPAPFSSVRSVWEAEGALHPVQSAHDAGVFLRDPKWAACGSHRAACGRGLRQLHLEAL